MNGQHLRYRRRLVDAQRGISVIDQAEAVTEREGHLPKPVVLIGIPGELTTIAGRRLRATVLDALSGTGVTDVALGTYANEYAQYITTLEEYSSQQYEGASTLFGPHTLETYQQAAAGLAEALAHGTPATSGPAPTLWSSPPQRRYRFRNLSNADITLRVYNIDDRVQLLTLLNGNKAINAHTEAAFPEREFTAPLVPTIEKLRVWVSDDVQPTMAAGQLLTIASDGSISVGDYTPPPRRAAA